MCSCTIPKGFLGRILSLRNRKRNEIPLRARPTCAFKAQSGKLFLRFPLSVCCFLCYRVFLSFSLPSHYPPVRSPLPIGPPVRPSLRNAPTDGRRRLYKFSETPTATLGPGAKTAKRREEEEEEERKRNERLDCLSFSFSPFLQNPFCAQKENIKELHREKDGGKNKMAEASAASVKHSLFFFFFFFFFSSPNCGFSLPGNKGMGALEDGTRGRRRVFPPFSFLFALGFSRRLENAVAISLSLSFPLPFLSPKCTFLLCSGAAQVSGKRRKRRWGNAT